MTNQQSIPPGYALYCGGCGKPWQLCRSQCVAEQSVSLPIAPLVEQAPAEETQPPPSGWRDRPGLA